MKILSIETSCDETGISILEIKGEKKPVFKVLANSLNSQTEIHSPYGGVFPALAKREHQKNLPILLESTLKKAKLDEKGKSVDLIAVTSGPGLEPALWTGIVFAQELSKKWKIPVIPVNHMEGHILSVFAEGKKTFSISKVKYPVLSLLVSGGHTELVLTEKFGKYKIIGETLDDAAGEAFDKVARMLGLPYPGGPEISKLAEEKRKKIVFEETSESENLKYKGKEKQASEGVLSATARKLQQFSSKKIAYPEKLSFSFPRPMLHSKNFDFSFSGLKTAVLYLIKKIEPLDDEKKKQIALEFENAVIETLVHKTKKALEKYGAKTLIVAGGVSANKFLKQEIKKLGNKQLKILFPKKELSTDNSIMIGVAGYLKFLRKDKKTNRALKIKAEGGLRL